MRDDYTGGAKFLHWLVAFIILVQFPLGWVMGDFAGIQKFKLYNLHKSLGAVVLTLMVIRVAWRLSHAAPALPGSMPPWERRAASLGHLALYLLLFLMPLTGWAMISASDKPSVFFRLTSFPLIPWIAELPVDRKKECEDLLKNVHEVLSNVLLTVVAIHVLAALRHAVVLRDGVLSRMLPGYGRGSRLAGAILATLLGGGVALWGADAARAAEWTVDYPKSKVSFEATGSGYTAKGAFGSYRADIQFDPNAPETASVRIKFDMKSVTTGVSDVDDALRSADFFDPAKFPTAEYVAKGAKSVGDGRYVLDGQLTLKGVTKAVELPFAIAIDHSDGKVRAEAKINRMDFGVGPESVAGLPIDKEVKLAIDLTALRAGN